MLRKKKDKEKDKDKNKDKNKGKKEKKEKKEKEKQKKKAGKNAAEQEVPQVSVPSRKAEAQQRLVASQQNTALPELPTGSCLAFDIQLTPSSRCSRK